MPNPKITIHSEFNSTENQSIFKVLRGNNRNKNIRKNKKKVSIKQCKSVSVFLNSKAKKPEIYSIRKKETVGWYLFIFYSSNRLTSNKLVVSRKMYHECDT